MIVIPPKTNIIGNYKVMVTKKYLKITQSRVVKKGTRFEHYKKYYTHQSLGKQILRC